TDGTKYYFVVRAKNAVATSAKSAEVSATPASPPNAPTHALAYPTKASVVLVWTPPDSDTSNRVTGYRIYKGTGAGKEAPTPVNGAALPASATSYTVTGLTNGKKYFFTIKAINGVGASRASNEVSAMPTTSPTVPLAARTVNGKPLTSSVALKW